MATQRRISALSSILGSMKSVKALGVSGAMMDYVEKLRQDEINSSKRVRWMNAIYNASGKLWLLSISTSLCVLRLLRC